MAKAASSADKRLEEWEKGRGQPAANIADEDEEDPFEASMAGIQKEVTQEEKTSVENSKQTQQKVRRDDLEDEDTMESYFNHMRKKGYDMNKGQPENEIQEALDSDEEVYATARAMEGEEEGAERRKEIEPLAPVGTQIKF
ncbi:hypothetical protein HK097_003844 [Rhizophlyctis rosea]|uniref:Uncharacterized protein n=1 Tax=Rhizophlyctis rosea TaxID=64517 RepID=A0AAD5X3Q9_9FUNG|nr:hypothetical protein HK097_003844 [Rhizophlyctis rosea]